MGDRKAHAKGTSPHLSQKKPKSRAAILNTGKCSKLYFGLDGSAPNTPGEIAERLYLTPKCVRQMHLEAQQQLSYMANYHRRKLDNFP